MIVNSFYVNLHILHIFNNGCVVLKDFVRFDQKRLDKRGKMAYNKRWKIAVYRSDKPKFEFRFALRRRPLCPT